jgi:hypothetical protein
MVKNKGKMMSKHGCLDPGDIFQFHKYSSNLEAMIATYHLHGKVAMWWDQLKQVEHIHENRITWK